MEESQTGELHNQEDVNPSSQLDKLVDDTEEVKNVKTNGTGGNRPVPTAGTITIKTDEDEEEQA